MKQFVLKKSGNEFDGGASTIQGGIAMPFFKDIDDWREWNDNRYIDDPGEPEEEKEDESNEDE